MNSPLDKHDELNWLAFRYVAGELDATEAASFEARMLDETAACEAVARMALLCETTYAAFDSQPSLPASRPSATRRLGIKATVASVAGVVALAALMTQQVASRLPSDDVEVARLWTASSMSSAGDSVTASSLDDGDGNASESVQGNELDVPEWMLAAVRLEASDDDEVMDN